VPYSILANLLPTVTLGGFPPGFSNPLADVNLGLALDGCFADSPLVHLGLPTWTGAAVFGLACAPVLVFVASAARAGPNRSWLPLLTGLLLATAVVTCSGRLTDSEARTLQWIRSEMRVCPAGDRGDPETDLKTHQMDRTSRSMRSSLPWTERPNASCERARCRLCADADS
jgi:hypothetical protein